MVCTGIERAAFENECEVDMGRYVWSDFKQLYCYRFRMSDQVHLPVERINTLFLGFLRGYRYANSKSYA